MVTVTATTAATTRFTKRVLRLTEALVARLAPDGAVAVFLVDDSFMEKNVLAFPAPKNFPRPDLVGRPLGEIYLNPRFIARAGDSLEYMLIHGFLHLLGYDHERERDRIAMERYERRLMRTFGLAR
jgi:rRNA maturation RNase YbeY